MRKQRNKIIETYDKADFTRMNTDILGVFSFFIY